ncbi:MAG: hypothetical protein GX256_05895 [Fretibacterium sp.]|nr:hypothetical protein [Fretibacterium sp.]
MPRLRRPGLTLAELLAALLLSALLATGLSLLPGPDGTSQKAHKEAQRAELWLLRSVARSARTRRGFTLRVRDLISNTLTLTWQNPRERETFEARKGYLFCFQGNSSEIFYSSQWNTFTPSATIRVFHPKTWEEHFIIISGYGRIRTASFPNRKRKR